MESPLKAENGSSRSFEEIRSVIDPVLFAKICEAVHHDKSSNTLDDEVEEVVEEVLAQIYPKESVHYKYQGQAGLATVLSSEKRGAMRFYYLVGADGVKLPTKLDKSHLKRRYTPSEKEVRLILENIAEKEAGKPWQVKEALREEFNIKDKLASIFCTPKAKKSLPTTTGRAEQSKVESSSEDENPKDVRRLSGIPPTKASKKKTEKEPKPKAKTKKQKPEGNANEKKEKQEKKPRKQKEKTDGGLEKFVKKDKSATENSDSPFMSPQKRSERRMHTVMTKLNESWRKRDYPEFLKSSSWAAKVLSGVQIDTISNDCYRMAIRRVFDAEKDKQNLKKLGNKEKKKEYRQTVIHARKATYKAADTKIKAHFSGKGIVEDLTLVDTPLSCPGRPITFADDTRMALFSDSMMITQFLSSLRQFIDVEEMVTAESLCNGLHEGRLGYYKSSVKVIIPMMKALIQDVEYKMLTHFDARLHEFNIHDANVSELCRALLLGKTKKEKKPKVHGYNQQHDDDDDQDDDDEVASKKDGSVKDESVKDEEMKPEPEENAHETGHEKLEEVELMLSRFTAAHEIWQLTPSVQMDLLKLLLFKILGLESCRDFLTEESQSDEAKSLSTRAKKLQGQLEEWREELTKLPEIDENVDLASLSRDQTRKRAERVRKRENLERKIEDNQDKLGELLNKLATEKLLQAQSKRLSCIGEDRHCRRYYWVPHKSPDAGIWIQDFGTTNFETFVKKCVADGESLEEQISGIDGEKKPRLVCENENVLDAENWYRIEDIGVLNRFVTDLKNGMRERELKKFLGTNLDLIVKAIRHGSQDKSKSASPESENEREEEEEHKEENGLSENPLDALKASVLEMYSDLRDGYLTRIDSAIFEPKVVSCESLEALKELIRELVDTVSQSNITVKLDFKDAKATGCYSWFMVDKWKARLAMAQNASAVHLLLSYFESRIDWKNSVKEKRCTVCNSKRSPEAKIVCSDCNLICHYYCVRPRMTEKPSTWACTACTRQNVLQARAARAARPKYVESDTEEDEEEEEENDDVQDQEEDEQEVEQDDQDETIDSDVFAADSDEESPKAKPRPAKKRTLVDSDEEVAKEEEDQPRTRSCRAKKPKISPINEEILSTWDKVKAANRMYRCLQLIPAPRKSRRSAPAVSLETLENSLMDYSSYESFVDDLRQFFDTAREYFESHNERKLDELEELIISLNLPESSQ